MRKKLISLISITLTFIMMFGLTFTAYASDSGVSIPREDSTETGSGTGAGVETISENGTTNGEEDEKETETGDDTEAGNESEAGIGNETGNDIGAESETISGNEIDNDGRAGEDTEEILNEELEVDPVVYSVSFPAIEQFKFFLDPYGLRGLQEGENATLEELKPYAGKVYCDNRMMVTNKSSVPIRLKVSIQLTGNVNAVETMEELEADDENNILLYIVPSENDMEGDLDNYQQSENGIVVKKDEPTVVEFLLPQSSYYYKENAEDGSLQYVIADGDTGHSSAFRIGGRINTKADWKSFDAEGEEVGLEIRYSFEDASDLPVQYSLENGPFGIQDYDGAVIDASEEIYE